jgi:hypothetical protein
MDHALLATIVIILALALLVLVLICNTPKQLVEIYENGLILRENNSVQELLYADVPYSMVRSHRGFMIVLGFKVTPQNPWIVIS